MLSVLKILQINSLGPTAFNKISPSSVDHSKKPVKRSIISSTFWWPDSFSPNDSLSIFINICSIFWGESLKLLILFDMLCISLKFSKFGSMSLKSWIYFDNSIAKFDENTLICLRNSETWSGSLESESFFAKVGISIVWSKKCPNFSWLFNKTIRDKQISKGSWIELIFFVNCLIPSWLRISFPMSIDMS